MAGFLAQLGKGLADKWLALLVLPGLLFTATAIAAYHLGQAHPLNPRPLTSWLDHLTAAPAAHHNSTVILAACVILLTSAAAGLAAEGLGAALQRLWAATGTRPPASWILRFRRYRWASREAALRTTARQRIAEAYDPAQPDRELMRARAAARRARRRHLASLRQPPQRPTRIADRFHVTASRARTLYGLSFDLVWPRLWTVLPDALRADITATRDSYASAARLAAWALMYGTLAVLWWPAALLATAVGATAVVQARAAATVLADLVDTAADLHLNDLAEKLHTAAPTPPGPDVGEIITRRLTVPHDPDAAAPCQPPAAAPPTAVP